RPCRFVGRRFYSLTAFVRSDTSLLGVGAMGASPDDPSTGAPPAAPSWPVLVAPEASWLPALAAPDAPSPVVLNDRIVILAGTVNAETVPVALTDTELMAFAVSTTVWLVELLTSTAPLTR